jgi:hypothetical protein
MLQELAHQPHCRVLFRLYHALLCRVPRGICAPLHVGSKQWGTPTGMTGLMMRVDTEFTHTAIALFGPVFGFKRGRRLVHDPGAD